MSNLLTLHNQHIPTMSPDARCMVWLSLGNGVTLPHGGALFLLRERQVDKEMSTLQLLVRQPGKTVLTASTPESLRFITTDALVRCVESDAKGPLRVLVEIGDMVAHPSLRQVAA